jgi:hypothetical protein
VQLDSIAQDTQGTVGYSLHHRKASDRLEKLGDEPFPTDSTLKVAIMCAVMEQVVSGKVGYHDTRQPIPKDKNAGGFFKVEELKSEFASVLVRPQPTANGAKRAGRLAWPSPQEDLKRCASSQTYLHR